MTINKFSKFCNKYNRVYKITIRSISRNNNKMIYKHNPGNKFFFEAYRIEDQPDGPDPEEGYQYLARISDAYDTEKTPLHWYRYRNITKFSSYA